MKKENFLISIIVNCFNGEKYLSRCIKSVLSQTYKNWEIIFWNNKSTDKSEKIIKNFSDKRIKIFRSKNFSIYMTQEIELFKIKRSIHLFSRYR